VGHGVENGLGKGHKGRKARIHGAADEKPATFVPSGLGGLVLGVLGRFSDRNLLSNIVNGGRIRHFSCKHDVGFLLENEDDVGAAKLEMGNLVAFLQFIINLTLQHHR